MAFVRRFIVQDRDSCSFLGFEDGDVVPVKLVKEAALFDSQESAALTALNWCDHGCVIFCFFIQTKEEQSA